MKRILSLLFFCANYLIAQDSLAPLIITATRFDREKLAPYSVTQLFQENLRQRANRTLPESLKDQPGILVQKTAHGHGSPFIRGFTGRQNLLMIDGIRLNNSTWRSGPVQYWNTVDSFAIDSIELIKSQGSVPYGSDAIGGTVNALSKSSNFLEEESGRLFAHGSAHYEYRSNGEGGHVGRLESQIGKGGKYGLHLGISQKDFGDIRDSAVGRMLGTGYDESAFDLRFDMLLSPGTSLTIASQDLDQGKVSRWHRTLHNPGWVHGSHVAAAGRWVANDYDQERSLSYFRLEQEIADSSSWIDHWSATLSYQKSSESEIQDRRSNVSNPFTSSNYFQIQGTDVDTIGVDISFHSPLAQGELVYGLDYYHDEVTSSVVRNPGAGLINFPTARPVADDAKYDLVGAFLNYSWNPSERWEMILGSRFTYAGAGWEAYRPQGSNQDLSGRNSWQDLSSSVRLSYEFYSEWILYSGISQSFRSPNLSDLTGTTTSLSGLDSNGSPELNPEKFLTIELGTAGEITGDIQAQIAVFHTFSTDGAIASYSSGGSTFMANSDESSIYGLEAEVIWDITSAWSLRGFFAWQEGKNTIDQRNPSERWIPRMLPFTALSSARYTASSNQWWIEARLSGAVSADRVHVADQTNDNQRIPTGGTPSYLVPSVYASYSFSKLLELNLGIENLSDVDYRIHGSGQNEAGLNFILGVNAKW